MWGVRNRALFDPRLPALWAGRRGPVPTGCGCGGVRAWGPVTKPTACALASWLCALWGRQEGARGGRLLPRCGASGVGRSPIPHCPPSWRAAGAHYPLAVGAGGWGRGDPSTTPQHALLRACFARCGGGTRAPGVVASCLGVGRPESGALPPPTARPLSGLPGPTTHWLWVRGVRVWGPVTNPTARALACCGGGMRAPGGGASCLGVGRLGLGALPPPTARPLGGLPGPGTHWPWVRGGAGVGTRHQPHSARSCELALRAVGAARGRPGGGASCPGVGRPGSGALRPPTARLLGGLTGPTTHLLWVRGGAGVGTHHQPHSARSCMLWGRHEGARGGLLLPWCGASGVERSSTPDCPPSGRAAGAQYPLAVGAGGCGHGDPSPTPQRALLRAGFARCGGGTGAPGGGASCLGVGRPGLGALRSSTARPWAGCWGPLPTGCGCGGVRAWGPVTNPTAGALGSSLCALWGLHEGARGGRLLPRCGATGVGRSLITHCPPSGRAAGAQYPLAVGAGGCECGDPSPTPQRVLLRAVGAA